MTSPLTPDPHDAGATPPTPSAPTPDVTPQPHGAYSFVQHLLASRVEILTTLLFDAILLVAAAFVRAAALYFIHLLGDPATLGWPIMVLEWILDFGVVGLAAVIAVFDFLKRVRVSFRDFQS